MSKPQRAVLFIDGNNWYHALKDAAVPDLGRLSYPKLAAKLVGGRELVGIRYYVGRMSQAVNTASYAAQRRFLSALRASDRRVSVHLGRLEPRLSSNAMASELRQLLAQLPVRLDAGVYRALSDLAARHANPTTLIEKAVDVQLAVDMVVMAERDRFDAAYLLSADGDFTPAVRAVRDLGKSVFAVSSRAGAQLGRVVNATIRVDRAWLTDCYRAKG